MIINHSILRSRRAPSSRVQPTAEGRRGEGSAAATGGGGSTGVLDARERELKQELRRVRDLRKQDISSGGGGDGSHSSGVMAQVSALQRRSAELREQQLVDEQRAREEAVAAQRHQRAEENELK